MSESEQLDIFIPLQRSARLREWAHLAEEEGFDVGVPDAVPAFAGWLRANGHAPPGLSPDRLRLLVAVMQEYERPASVPVHLQ